MLRRSRQEQYAYVIKAYDGEVGSGHPSTGNFRRLGVGNERPLVLLGVTLYGLVIRVVSISTFLFFLLPSAYLYNPAQLHPRNTKTATGPQVIQPKSSSQISPLLTSLRTPVRRKN